jgi:hypothetical protein
MINLYKKYCSQQDQGSNCLQQRYPASEKETLCQIQDWGNSLREILETLMLTHFPESHIVRDTNVVSEDTPNTMDGSWDEAWRRSKEPVEGLKGEMGYK